MRSQTISAICAALAMSFVLSRVALAVDTPPATDIPPNLDPAIAKGLSYMAKQQQPDGGLELPGQPRVAITGLGVMAFLASGHTQDTGKYGLNVRRAVDFLVKSLPADGYYGQLDGS